MLTAASSVRITNTSIYKPVFDLSPPVETVATTVDTCLDNPCTAGSQCTFKDSSTFCESCRETEIGEDGISCTTCQPGTQPDGTRTVCEPCD
eukprot:COSAG04_NODE_7977_length_1039_cov_1.161702_1_plen_91_part_10